MNDNQDQIAYTPEEEEQFNLIDTAANQQAEYSGVKTQSARIAQLEDGFARLALYVTRNAENQSDADEVELAISILQDK